MDDLRQLGANTSRLLLSSLAQCGTISIILCGKTFLFFSRNFYWIKVWFIKARVKSVQLLHR